MSIVRVRKRRIYWIFEMPPAVGDDFKAILCWSGVRVGRERERDASEVQVDAHWEFQTGHHAVIRSTVAGNAL